MFGLVSKSIFKFAKLDSVGLSARKYLRSISQSALHYRPAQVRQFDETQSTKDRVVQQFFDSYSLAHRIKVFQAQNRLKQLNTVSTPAHSFYQVILPFKQNQHLRRRMIQFFEKYVRVGRILQLMDYIASNVAYRYCIPSSLCLTNKQFDDLPFFIVTAAIDQIDFFHPIVAQENCSFSGYVSYVGSSSMEVQIAVTQIIDGKQRLSCSAKFVMVARDKKSKKAYKVPALDLSNQPESLRIKNQLGEKRQKTRKQQGARALNLAPPTYQQSSEVHNLMLKLSKQKHSSQNHNNFVPLGNTVQKSTQLMHLQDKNLSGKIFGGFIMRLAYQLGWLTAYKFIKGNFPKCTHIDDVQFLAPVQIGSIVQLQSVVSYVNQQIIHVIVDVKNTQPSGETHLTNILRINFEHHTKGITNVFPVTLAESAQYIESMRRVKKYLSN